MHPSQGIGPGRPLSAPELLKQLDVIAALSDPVLQAASKLARPAPQQLSRCGNAISDPGSGHRRKGSAGALRSVGLAGLPH